MTEIHIKTSKEIETMRKAGKILANILFELKKEVKPGLDVWKLEEKFLQLCKQNNVTPSCKGYGKWGQPPFPTGLCVSINSQSVHCFPKKGVILKNGDIISVDTVIDLNGLKADSAFCIPVGKVSDGAEKLIKITEEALYNSISKVRNKVKVGVISEEMQNTVERAGFNVLKDYAGHGIGYSMHEEPEIACYGNKNDGPELKAGMIICIEALVCAGKDKVKNLNEWETEMADSKLFCIFEHTVLVTKDGYEILTK